MQLLHNSPHFDLFYNVANSVHHPILLGCNRYQLFKLPVALYSYSYTLFFYSKDVLAWILITIIPVSNDILEVLCSLVKKHNTMDP